MRSAALVDTYMDCDSQKKGDAQDAQDVIWDHARDMSVGGRPHTGESWKMEPTYYVEIAELK